MENNKDILGKFKEIAEHGISDLEVEAAGNTLARELGRRPTVYEIAEYMEDFIRWRHFHRKWKTGEVKIKYEYTGKGKKIRGIEAKVNNIFITKGGD